MLPLDVWLFAGSRPGGARVGGTDGGPFKTTGGTVLAAGTELPPALSSGLGIPLPVGQALAVLTVAGEEETSSQDGLEVLGVLITPSASPVPLPNDPKLIPVEVGTCLDFVSSHLPSFTVAFAVGGKFSMMASDLLYLLLLSVFAPFIGDPTAGADSDTLTLALPSTGALTSNADVESFP